MTPGPRSSPTHSPLTDGTTPTLYQMWHVVLPLKGTDDAKSRLQVPPSARKRMVVAMAADTMSAVQSTPDVHRVTVLSRQAGGALTSFVERAFDIAIQPPEAASLDEALQWFASTRADRATPLAVVVADLPALTPQSMADVLMLADKQRMGMVADSPGTGTTILTARDPAEMITHFGDQSASAHQADGARLLPGAEDARCDVDTVDDLMHATALGLGPHTLALLAELELEPN